MGSRRLSCKIGFLWLILDQTSLQPLQFHFQDRALGGPRLLFLEQGCFRILTCRLPLLQHLQAAGAVAVFLVESEFPALLGQSQFLAIAPALADAPIPSRR